MWFAVECAIYDDFCCASNGTLKSVFRGTDSWFERSVRGDFLALGDSVSLKLNLSSVLSSLSHWELVSLTEKEPTLDKLIAP